MALSHNKAINRTQKDAPVTLNVSHIGDKMKTYGNWRKIKSPCIHCDAQLESRPVYGGVSFVISGAEPMEYRHVDCGCKNPAVHSCWNKYNEWLTSGSSGQAADSRR
jgi:hypothetical protein